MNTSHNNSSEDMYLFIIYSALERYSLFMTEFYELNEWKQIYKYPVLVNCAYVALDLWNSEKFIGLDITKHREAKLILLALLNS